MDQERQDATFYFIGGVKPYAFETYKGISILYSGKPDGDYAMMKFAYHFYFNNHLRSGGAPELEEEDKSCGFEGMEREVLVKKLAIQARKAVDDLLLKVKEI